MFHVKHLYNFIKEKEKKYVRINNNQHNGTRKQ